mmetsp:Transcript_78625/g.255224  ORF Transcript_78625/g.255224 Transcript_78625/m.255224 type:complete len:291 (+) Transcript_78625:3215-4087(+)
MALCKRLLQGCRKKISRQRGSNCSLRRASKISPQPVFASIVTRLITSKIVTPAAGTEPIGIDNVAVCDKDASIKLRIFEKCELMSRIRTALRPFSRSGESTKADLKCGEGGGERTDRRGTTSTRGPSSTPMLTTSSSPTNMEGGDKGDKVGVDGMFAELVPTEVWKTIFDKMVVAADTPLCALEKMRSTNALTTLSVVNCLIKSSLKNNDSFCESNSRMIRATCSCASKLVSPPSASNCCSSRETQSSVANTTCEGCSAHRSRAKSSARDLKCKRSRNLSSRTSAPFARK